MQGKLTKDTEERIKQHNETSKLNAEALHEDLRRQAETIEAELQERIQEFFARRQATKTQPTTPEPDRTRNSHPASPNHQPAWRTQPASNTPEREPPRNPCQRAPPVSPYHDVDIPSEDEWNKQVSRCKEKVTLKHSLPENAKDFDQDKAFYRQTECDFKGHPAVRLRKLDDLNRRGNAIPIEYEMGWPPEHASECSAIPYEKLTEAIPHALTTLRNILTTYQNDRNGCQALMSIMKRTIPRLGQLPPKMEPTWPKGLTPTAHANKSHACIQQQQNFGRRFCDFEIAATMAQRAMEHHEHHNVASTRATQLVQIATKYDNFQEIRMREEEDKPHVFATMLENYKQESQQHQVNVMATGFDPSINKFERGNQNGRSNNRTPREGDRDGEPKETCPCCLRRGHNVEKGSACWMGAQVENVLTCN
jgi:hypothetical protein